jgi:gluconolactonase
MTRGSILMFVTFLAGSALVLAQADRPIRPMTRTNPRVAAPKELIAPDIPGVVKGGTKVVLVASGFNGGEGAITMPDGSLLFTEQGANKIIKVGTDDRTSTYLENTNRTTGLAFDRTGRLIGVGAMPPQILVLAPTRSVLFAEFEGQPLMRPNDLVIDRKGGMYITDPNIEGGRRPLIFYVTPDGRLTKATEQISYPNGIQLSPDEKTLYASNGTAIIAFDVLPDGSLTNSRTFAASAGDGMAVDNDGRLYATLSFLWHPPTDVQGVRVFSGQGQVLGIIPTGVPPSSVAFAGPDKTTLYTVGAGGVQKVQMIAKGVAGRAK